MQSLLLVVVVRWLWHPPQVRKAGVALPSRVVPLTGKKKTGILSAMLPGAWLYWVRAWTGWLGVTILCLDEIASLSHNFHLCGSLKNCRSISDRLCQGGMLGE